MSLTAKLQSKIGIPPEYYEAATIPLSKPARLSFSYGPAPFQLFGENMRRKLAAAEHDENLLLYL